MGLHCLPRPVCPKTLHHNWKILLPLQGLQKVVAVSLVIGYRNKATDAVIAAIKKKKSEETTGAEAKAVK